MVSGALTGAITGDLGAKLTSAFPKAAEAVGKIPLTDWAKVGLFNTGDGILGRMVYAVADGNMSVEEKFAYAFSPEHMAMDFLGGAAMYGMSKVLPKIREKLPWNKISNESGTSSIGRMDLAGKTHPVSGVKFDSNGFPIFEQKYNTKLDPQDYLKSRGTHFDRASKALYNDIMNDSNLRSKFTEAEIAIFKEGGVPKAYTWHHHQDEGVMQLVDRKIHRQTGHTGGFSIWGPEN